MPRNRRRLPVDLRAPARASYARLDGRLARRAPAGDIRISESVADHLRDAVTTTLAQLDQYWMILVLFMVPLAWLLGGLFIWIFLD